MAGFMCRCDGSAGIGMGHVMRCYALALALQKHGHRVCFATRESPGMAMTVVREAGFKVESICYPKHGQNAELSERDLERTAEVARWTGARCVLVDHYGASAGYLAGLRRKGIRVAVIDDLADRDLTAVDWVLNQNLGASALPYLVRSDCVQLLGPAYALLRPEFAVAHEHLSRQFSTEDRRVLLTLGGGDTAALCSGVFEALNWVSHPLEVRCVVGGEGPTSTGLTGVRETSQHEVRIFQNAMNMADLMVWADLSINAGGSTCWELCCLGVPMLILVTSRDQASIASALESEGCAKRLGEWRSEAGRGELACLVEGLLEDPERRAVMSSRAQVLVDGRGAARAAQSLMDLLEAE